MPAVLTELHAANEDENTVCRIGKATAPPTPLHHQHAPLNTFQVRVHVCTGTFSDDLKTHGPVKPLLDFPLSLAMPFLDATIKGNTFFRHVL
jgi:hypothetical protein